MSRKFWLVKSEPDSYSWDDFTRDQGTTWSGVRNYQARNNLRAMQKNDAVLFYHSVEGKEVMGIAKIAKTAYPDASAEAGDWSCVDLVPTKKLTLPVSLETIKTDKALANIALIKNSRLSVQPLTPGEFERILVLGKTKL